VPISNILNLVGALPRQRKLHEARLGSFCMLLILGYVEIIPVLYTDATPRGHMRV
jgi:hypothetical protein